MSVPFSSYYGDIRAICQDDDPDFNLLSNEAIDSRIRLALNTGKVRGYQVGTDNQSVIAAVDSNRGRRGYAWSYENSYAASYGWSFDYMYSNPYDFFYDQAQAFYLNFLTQSLNDCIQTDNDLTPTGAPREYVRLIYECANMFLMGITNFHFRIRSVTETIAAPKELIRWMEAELYTLVNGGAAGPRPQPLPLIALGIRSLYSGLWLGGDNYSGSAYGWANVVVALVVLLCVQPFA